MMSCRIFTAGLLMSSALVAMPALAHGPGHDGGPAGPAAVAATARDFIPTHLLAAVCGMPGHHGDAAFQRRVQLVEAVRAQGGGQAEAEEPPLYNWLGEHSYAIATGNEQAQRYFDQGLRLTYAFNHPEALRAFRKAQDLDPDCAMCYWGEAYALGPNINAPMDPAAIGPAAAAIGNAQAHADGARDHERALIEALTKRYSADAQTDRAALDQAYADAMAEVAARFPEDTDILSLYADSLMNLAPWNYWEADGSTLRAPVKDLVPTLESALAKSPHHPYAIHLYIHAVEASTAPERAETYADRLGATMPGAGHVVHMPGHIYFRIGRFQDSIDSNLAAVSADEYFIAEADPQGWYQYSYYPHNVHFLLESARMAGDGATALDASEKLPGIISDEVAHALPWVEIIKAAPYFAHAQFSAPEAVLGLADPGDESPYVRAMWHYARGVTEARRGNAQAAEAEAEAIAAIGEGTDWTHMVEGGVPAPDLLRLARHAIAGRIAQAQGDGDRAAEEFRAAVAIQDTLPYLEPPYWYYPMRQSLGAALLQAGRAEEAERTFRAALDEFPNNAWALYGLMEAQKAQGNDAGAAETEQRFRQAWAGAAEPNLDLAQL